jgi:ABC-type lipoprotein release transport system permease subunit
MEEHMNKKTTKVSLIAAFILLVIILGLLVWMIISIIHLFSSLQKEVIATIIAVTGTVLVSVFSVIVTKYLERKRAIEQEIRNKKIPMYEFFVEFWFKVIYIQKQTGKEMSEQEMIEFFTKFTQQIMVWGSDSVIKRWSDFRNKIGTLSQHKEDFSFALMFEFEQLLLEIRKDTGHKNKKLVKGDLLGLFINDLDKYL